MNYKKNLLALAVVAACGGQMSQAGAQSAAANNQGVDEVLVFGTYAGSESTTGSRLGLTVQQIPATVDIIDGNAIRARIDTSVMDAVTRSAGFTNEANPGNGFSSISARGFSGQNAVTKLYDGTHYFTIAGAVTFPFDTWGIDRVEVLKGPASVMYGEGGIGGAINIIPRKPKRERSGEVRLIAGENATTFLGLDYTDALGESLAYRLDYSNSQSDGWVNNGASDAEMFSAALQWDVNDALVLSARYDRGVQNPMRYFGVPILNGDFFDDFVESNFNVSDADIHYEDDSLRVKADWEISDTVSLQAEVYRLSSDRFWKNMEGYAYDESTQLVERLDPLILGHDIEQTGMRTNFVFAPSDSIRASVGVESNDIDFSRPTNFGNAGNPNGITFDESDTVDPYNFQPGTFADITTAPVLLDNSSDMSQRAVFGEVQFNPTEQLAIVGGLRYDDYDALYQRSARPSFAQKVDDTIGRIGVVYDLSNDNALYAQYSTGSQHPGGSVVNVTAGTREANMIESEQLELGVKHQVSGTGLQWSVALFDITKNNLIVDDPTSGNPDVFSVIPEQTSQGVEVGFTYTITPGFQIYGNATALNAETNTGETPDFVPEETLNLGVALSFAEQFRIIADARYVGERFHPDVPMPSYTVVDASARWDVNSNVGFTLKADNLFDELYATSNYYLDTWAVGRPRTVSIAFDYSF